MPAEGRPWLIIPVEVQVREWLSRLLVATIAADRGFDVLIGHDRVIRRLAAHLPRGIMFDKSLGAKGDRKTKRYAALGYTLTAIDEESTGFHAHPDLYLSARLSEETIALAQRWFCLSESLREKAAQDYPAHASKFVTTGLPRTDLWRPAFQSLFEEERKALARRHGRYILFCSNFGRIVHAREQAFVDNQFRKFDATHDEAKNYREQIVAEGKVNLQAFLEMLPKLRQWFPDHKLVIRPHPSESRDFWRGQFAGIDGVAIEEGGLATPAILGSDCLVHHGCTTGIEAELLGKPHVMYAPFPDRHHDTPVMEAFAPIEKTEDALRERIGAILQGERSPRNRLRQAEFYSGIDGELVSSRIAASLGQLPARRKTGLPFYLPAMQYSPRQLVADYWPRSARARAYSKQKWQGVSLQDAREKAETLSRCAGIAASVHVEEVYPDLFRVSAGVDATGRAEAEAEHS